MACLPADLTVIVTTSASPIHPDTSMTAAVLKSLARCCPAALPCRKIVVCDGHPPPRDDRKAAYKRGRITAAKAEAYAEYQNRLAAHVAAGAGCWQNAALLRLEGRHGFGFAVRAALAQVRTEFVLVIQHDRNFNRPVDLGHVMGLMREHGERAVGYAGLLTGRTMGYPKYIKDRYNLDLLPLVRAGGELVPLLFFFDSTQVLAAPSAVGEARPCA